MKLPKQIGSKNYNEFACDSQGNRIWDSRFFDYRYVRIPNKPYDHKLPKCNWKLPKQIRF